MNIFIQKGIQETHEIYNRHLRRTLSLQLRYDEPFP